MSREDAYDYINCACAPGCSQICNAKYRGECCDSYIFEALQVIKDALDKLDLYEMLMAEQLKDKEV